MNLISFVAARMHLGARSRMRTMQVGTTVWVLCLCFACQPHSKEDPLHRSVSGKLQPVVNPEFGMDTPVSGAAFLNQTRSSLATGNTASLVVWLSQRDGSNIVFGTRVDAFGNSLNTPGLLVSTLDADHNNPQLAFDETNDNWLVVWEDYRSGKWEIYGTRVSDSGFVMDPSGIPISTGTFEKKIPALLYDGTLFWVVWQDNRNPTYDIFGARVSGSGILLDPDGIPISTANGNQYSPSITFQDTQLMVVWADARNSTLDIFGTRMTNSGTILDSALDGFPISTAQGDQMNPRTAHGQTYSLVVWEDARDANNDVYGARLETTGNVLEGVATGFAVSNPASNQMHPDIAFDGTNFMVVWDDWRGGVNSDLYGSRVKEDGTVLDDPSTGFEISAAANDQLRPSIGFDAPNFFVTWEDNQDASTDWNIKATRVATDGVVSDPSGKLVSQGGNSQINASAVSTGSMYLIVWQDFRNRTNWDIYATRLNANGNILDTVGIPVSIAGNDQSFPKVSVIQDLFWVVWEDTRNGIDNPDLFGARISTSGVLLDHVTNGISVSINGMEQFAPKLACNTSNCLVVWEDYRNSDADIYGTRVEPDGTVLDTPAAGFPISLAVDDQYGPDIAFDGTNFLIVWEDYRSGAADIFGTRVSPDADVFDLIATGFAISTASDDQYTPSIAFVAPDFLVAWEDYRLGSADIFGTRVSPNVQVWDDPSSGITLCSSDDDQYYPVIARDGDKWIVLWEDWRNATNADLYATWVTGSGTVTEPGGVVISESSVDELQPAVICLENGFCVTTYNRYDVELDSHRVFAREFTRKAPIGSVCSNDASCASGFCTDGICCNHSCGNGNDNDCQACSKADGANQDGFCLILPMETVCQISKGLCDMAEKCNGTSPYCPADEKQPDGFPCDDEFLCNGIETCTQGECVSGEAINCDDNNECTNDQCEEPGTCSNSPLSNATPCPGGFCEDTVCVNTSDGFSLDGSVLDAIDGPSDGEIPPKDHLFGDSYATDADMGSIDVGSNDSHPLGDYGDIGNANDLQDAGSSTADHSQNSDLTSEIGIASDSVPTDPSCGCAVTPKPNPLFLAILFVLVMIRKSIIP